MGHARSQIHTSPDPEDSQPERVASMPPSALDDLRQNLAGELHRRSFHEVADLVHERLLSAGATESDALEVNRQLRETVQPRTPRFRTFEFFLTRFCNLDCPYCFVHSKALERMTRATADAAVEFLVEQWDHDSFVSVVFMGGEPTTAFPLLKHVVTSIERRIPPNRDRYRFDITTNGTLMTEPMMRFFASQNVKVLVSIDGDRGSHDLKRRTADGQGSFDRIVQNIPLIRRFQPYMGARMTPTPETIHNLLHDVQTVARLGFSKLIIGPATGVEWPNAALATLEQQTRAVLEWRQHCPERERLDISLDEVSARSTLCGNDHRWGCRAGRTGLAIDIDGQIYPCSKIIGTGKPRGGLMRLGDVFHGITETDMHLKLNGHVPVKRSTCWSCGVRGSCLGGCYAANIEATGDPFDPAPETCEVTKTMVQLGRELAAEEVRQAAELTGKTKTASAAPLSRPTRSDA